MPLIICPDCQNQISDQARSCPHCGRPIVLVTPAQAEAAKTVAGLASGCTGLTSGCFWGIVGLILLLLALFLCLLTGHK